MIDLYIPIAVLFLLALVEAFSGAYTSGKYKLKDWIVGIIAITQFVLLVRPLIIAIVAIGLSLLFPNLKDAFAEMNFWLAFVGYLLIDEFLHYWFHRLGHEKDWLWNLHETHHASESINTSVAFKTNVFWVMIMPELYFSALCLWLGIIWPLVVAHTFKGALEFFYHFNGRPDLFLHRNKYLKPIGWLLERVLVLQDTHHAHHGCGLHGNDKRNFGGTLMIWDIVFGTAYFPHAEQEQYGIVDYEDHPWYHQLYWPLVKSKSTVSNK